MSLIPSTMKVEHVWHCLGEYFVRLEGSDESLLLDLPGTIPSLSDAKIALRDLGYDVSSLYSETADSKSPRSVPRSEVSFL